MNVKVAWQSPFLLVMLTLNLLTLPRTLRRRVQLTPDSQRHLVIVNLSLPHALQVVSYHSPMTHESCLAVKAQFERHLPTHKPLWTAIGVASLALPEMQIEIELWADVSSNEGGKKQ